MSLVQHGDPPAGGTLGRAPPEDGDDPSSAPPTLTSGEPLQS